MQGQPTDDASIFRRLHAEQARTATDLAVRLCQRAKTIVDTTIEQGREVDGVAVFEQALADLDYNRGDLLRLWGILLCGSHVVKKALEREQAESESESKSE